MNYVWYNPNYTVPICQSPDADPCAGTQWWFMGLVAILAYVGTKNK